jgi:hypothetical protein
VNGYLRLIYNQGCRFGRRASYGSLGIAFVFFGLLVPGNGAQANGALNQCRGIFGTYYDDPIWNEIRPRLDHFNLIGQRTDGERMRFVISALIRRPELTGLQKAAVFQKFVEYMAENYPWWQAKRLYSVDHQSVLYVGTLGGTIIFASSGLVYSGRWSMLPVSGKPEIAREGAEVTVPEIPFKVGFKRMFAEDEI